MDLVSGRPFWPLKNGLIATYPPLEENRECAVAVIGAGITGALVAYHLAEAGVDVVVVDRRDVATGSTSASTALLQYEIDVPLHQLSRMIGENHAVRAYRCCRATLKKFARLERKLGGESEFKRTRSFYGASRSAHVARLRREFSARQAHGFDVAWWDRRRIAASSALPHAAAIISADAAQVDAHRFTHALLAAAVRLGARVYDRTTIVRRQAKRHGVTLTTDHGFKLHARKLVVAAGYETEPYLPEKLTQLHTTFSLVTEPVADFTGWPADQALVWETARPYAYLRTTADRRIIFGGYDEASPHPHRREALLPGKTELLRRRLHTWLPEIPFEVATSWAGTFAETPDGLPYIGENPRIPHTYFALGYGGNGITFSLIAAEIIRDLFLGEPNRDADLFRFDRIA